MDTILGLGGLIVAVPVVGLWLFWEFHSIKKLLLLTKLDHMAIINGTIAVGILTLAIGYFLGRAY